MDRDPLEQFEDEAQALGDGEKLATIAELLAGEGAGALLIGAALKVMERQFGYEAAIAQARIALEVIVNAKPAGAGYN